MRHVAISLTVGCLLSLALACQTDLPDGYYRCAAPSAGDADERCRDGYTCRSVEGTPGCVPAEEADQFDPVDDGSDAGDAGDTHDTDDAATQDTEDTVEVVDPPDADATSDADDGGSEDSGLTTCDNTSAEITGTWGVQTVDLNSEPAQTTLQFRNPQELTITPSGTLPDDASLEVEVAEEPVESTEALYNIGDNVSRSVRFEPTALGRYVFNIYYFGQSIDCEANIVLTVAQPENELYIELLWGLDNTSGDAAVTLLFKNEGVEWKQTHNVVNPDFGGSDWEQPWGSRPFVWSSEPPPGPVSMRMANDGSVMGEETFDLALAFESAAQGSLAGRVLVILPSGNEIPVGFNDAPLSSSDRFLNIGKIQRDGTQISLQQNKWWGELPEGLSSSN